MSRNQVTITVSGGDIEENRQLSTMVHACLQERGFTNVAINHLDTVQNVSLREISIFDLVRSMNPEVFDAPIVVVGETEEDIRAAENAALDGLYFHHRPAPSVPHYAMPYLNG